ncbi:MAG: cupin domain-containing protein [Candidatus Pacebacteria bacterium]|jgi:mannose-6-phosphate isomerase-like protein (cupin superfamily)|nr:cupin domain-containing protein [Candidatus Paceibacterota bacterium]
MKKGYKGNIESLTKENTNFRKVLYTGHNSQLVLMSLLPGEDIGMEVHGENDQFFRFDAGVGRVVVDGTEYDVKDGDAVVVPMGAEHNVINTSDSESLKFYTIYSPAHHKDQIVRTTKEEALANEEEFDGQTTE